MVKISVIMPVYNDADRLNVSIGSILSQTLSDIEIICVNDGSTDNSLEILKGFEEKYDFIKIIKVLAKLEILLWIMPMGIILLF